MAHFPNETDDKSDDKSDDDEPGTAPTRPAKAGTTTRSSRIATEPDRLTYDSMSHHQEKKSRTVHFEDEEWYQMELCHNLITKAMNVSPNPEEDIAYSPQMALIMARLICDINSKTSRQGASFAQQFILQKGIKKFGHHGKAAARKEIDQLHCRTCFTPIDISTLTEEEEKAKAMEALMFLTEKRDGTIKGRAVYNGKPTRVWLKREESTSPTAFTESIFLTAIVDAKERRDVMSNDVPNAFIQAWMPKQKDGEARVIMKITGVLVDYLVDIAPEVYGPYVVFENGRKVLYVQVLKALYGMLVAALLWYKKFRGDLEKEGFEFNPYDPCVCNCLVNGKQHTVRFHVDDLMSSHKDKRVNDRFLEWLNKMYGGYGEVKGTRGYIHDYLGMTFDFSEKGKVKVDMIDYVSAMVDDFPIKFKPNDTAPTPAAEDLFAEGTGEKLDKECKENFHTFVAKGLFACKSRECSHESP